MSLADIENTERKELEWFHSKLASQKQKEKKEKENILKILQQGVV